MKNIVTFLLSLTLLFSSVFAFAETGKININTANVATLAANLKGIGPKKAQAIVDFRTENGAFNTVDDLTLVSGIGPKLLERNRDIITVVDAVEIIAEESSNVEAVASSTEASDSSATATETKHVTTKVTETVTDETKTKIENQTAANSNTQTSAAAAQTKTTVQVQK